MAAESTRPHWHPSSGPTPWPAYQPVHVNGHPALIIRLNGEIDAVIAVRIDDGLITGFYAVWSPEKLSHVERETALHR